MGVRRQKTMSGKIHTKLIILVRSSRGWAEGAEGKSILFVFKTIFFLVLRIEPRALHVLSKHSATEWEIQSLSGFSPLKQDLSKLFKLVLNFLCSPHRPWTCHPAASAWWVVMIPGRSHRACLKISFEKNVFTNTWAINMDWRIKIAGKKKWVDNKWLNKQIFCMS